jgi:alpha-ribazole phosphatase
MLRLILTRHGETAWNAQGRYQGQHDIALNAVGRAQAAALAARLATQRFDAIYASDLKRAWATAEAIAARHSLPVTPEPRLREQCFGVFQGLTFAEIRARYPAEFAAWQADRDNAPPGGETITQFAARVGAVLGDLTRAHEAGTVLLVAHGGSMRELICRALDLRPDARWSLGMDNASISELRVYDEGVVLHALNDATHLNGASSGSQAMSSA